MRKKGKGEITISSTEEFRKRYLPKRHEERILSTPEEAREYGATLARNIIENIRVSR